MAHGKLAALPARNYWAGAGAAFFCLCLNRCGLPRELPGVEELSPPVVGAAVAAPCALPPPPPPLPLPPPLWAMARPEAASKSAERETSAIAFIVILQGTSFCSGLRITRFSAG